MTRSRPRSTGWYVKYAFARMYYHVNGDTPHMHIDAGGGRGYGCKGPGHVWLLLGVQVRALLLKGEVDGDCFFSIAIIINSSYRHSCVQMQHDGRGGGRIRDQDRDATLLLRAGTFSFICLMCSFCILGGVFYRKT